MRSSLCLRFANTGKVAASGANVYRKCVFVQIVLASADFIQVTCKLGVWPKGGNIVSIVGKRLDIAH